MRPGPATSSPSRPPLLTWPAFDPTRVKVALTTRDGGVSTGRLASLNLGLHVDDSPANVVTNRSRAASAFGAPLDDVVFCQQVHDRAVTVIDDEDRGRGVRSADDAVPATDAMVTASPGPVLAVLVADCVPLVLHDPDAAVLAVVHAGWRGTVRGVTQAAVDTMTTFGATPRRIVAGIGPAIGADVYQVGEDVAVAAREAFGDDVAAVLRPDGTGHYLFDLVTAARLQLRTAGLAEENIHPSGLVTGPGTPFYSHRLEQPTGRFAVFAQLQEASESDPAHRPQEAS